MVPKKTNRWDSSFEQTLSQKKEKEDAEYLALVQSRTDAIKRTLTAQRRKDNYDRIMREFDDPEKRDAYTVDKHKENIKFLEVVLKENMQWRAHASEPLQLKPNLVMLQEKIHEMKDYVAERLGSRGESANSAPVNQTSAGLAELTLDQSNAVYVKARGKILDRYGGILERMAMNVKQGLPIERARERLLALGVTKQVLDALNEMIREEGCQFTKAEKSAIKLQLLHPGRLGVFLDEIIEMI